MAFKFIEVEEENKLGGMINETGYFVCKLKKVEEITYKNSKAEKLKLMFEVAGTNDVIFTDIFHTKKDGSNSAFGQKNINKLLTLLDVKASEVNEYGIIASTAGNESKVGVLCKHEKNEYNGETYDNMSVMQFINPYKESSDTYWFKELGVEFKVVEKEVEEKKVEKVMRAKDDAKDEFPF